MKNLTKNKNAKFIILGILVLLIIVVAWGAWKHQKQSTPLVEGCQPGDEFSETSGLHCDGEPILPCQGDDVYNITTGEKCPGK